MTAAFTAALLHFLWQGLLIAALLRAALAVLRSSNARYAAGCAALAVMMLLPALTTLFIYSPPVPATPAATIRIAPSAASQPIPPPVRPDWRAIAETWTLPLWSIGVLLFSFRMVWGCAQVAAFRRRGAPASEDTQSTVAALAARLRVVRPVRVLISTLSDSPSVVGWLRPVILLPASALSGLAPEHLEAILAHELAHIRRCDYLVNLVQMVVETVLFYHPAVWWVSRSIRRERELCCDDLAAQATGGALVYARALTALEKLRVSAPSMAMAATHGSLYARIERLLGARAEHAPSKLAGALAITLALVCGAATIHWAHAQTASTTQQYLEQGDRLLKSGDHVAALAAYQDGLVHNPPGRLTFQKRIIETLARMNRWPEAEAVNAQILKEHPDDSDARALSAARRLEHGEDAAPIAQELERLIERVPENPIPHLDLGRAYAQLSRFEDARREIEEALRLRPDFRRAELALERLNAAGSPQEEVRLRQERTALTAQFLRDELQAAQEKLTALRHSQNASSQNVAQAERDLAELQRRVISAQLAVAPQRLAQQLQEDSTEAARLQSILANLQERIAATAADSNDARARLIQEQTNAVSQLNALLRRIQQTNLHLTNLPSLESALPTAGRSLATIEYRGLSDVQRNDLAGRLPVHAGDVLTPETIAKALDAVLNYDSRLEFSIRALPDNQAVLTITLPDRK